MIERLKVGPDPPAQKPGEATTMSCQSAASPWTLRSLQSAFAKLVGYSLSGVWRAFRRLKLKLRSARVQQYSPDPE